MSKSIPIRDLAGKIMGMRSVEPEADPVQATIDASMKAVGAEAEKPHEPAKPDAPKLPRSQIALGLVLISIWVVGIVMSSGRTRTPATLPTAPIATVTRTATTTATPTPSPTTTPTMTPKPTAEPTMTPVPTEPPLPTSTPFPVPALVFCADRSSIWGSTHQCGSTQAAADALADGEIAKINATAEAIRDANKK
jgi:hypothetical protein